MVMPVLDTGSHDNLTRNGPTASVSAREQYQGGPPVTVPHATATKALSITLPQTSRTAHNTQRDTIAPQDAISVLATSTGAGLLCIPKKAVWPRCHRGKEGAAH